MTSPRPRSPRPPVAVRKEDKEESIWEKIGTLGRKKRIKEGKSMLGQTYRWFCRFSNRYEGKLLIR